MASRLNGSVILTELCSGEMNHFSLGDRTKMDYAPHAVDGRPTERHNRDYASGKALEAPIYDFAKHMRVATRHNIFPLGRCRWWMKAF